ncbi:MAG: acetoacetate--CoA ligase [Flavobacteriales bacterium]|nr:MAG: acetoacetate--CoA ligase [Flavobacteriales bacterium]
MSESKFLWKPSREFTESSNMYHYTEWLAVERQLHFNDYHSLWSWSVENIEDFWQSIWDYYQIKSYSSYSKVLQMPSDGMIGAKWFEGATLNYAEHIFRNKTNEYPALVYQSETQPLMEISWEELEKQVTSMAAWLKSIGIEKGDRVAAFLPNIPQAVVAFLAANSMGAVWSSCSPDFGTPSVIDRFQQIKPKVLFVVDGYTYNGKTFSKTAGAKELLDALPTVEKVVFVPFFDQSAKPAGISNAVLWAEAVNTPANEIKFEQVPFDHPIWVLYSSGTTGKPKAITHSVGGCLLEHYKALGLHQNCKQGDRFFWYSTTGWMMWNYTLASLLTGATMVIYDGSAGYPNRRFLWDFAENAKITHFGGGAAYYISCMKKKMDFTGKGMFQHLQSVGSTGSPLPPEAFEWIYNSVKKDVWLISLSGGTDVCSGFVGGSPFLPVHAGEIQCRMLGCKVEAFNENGESVADEVSEMVLTKPMPSMPVYFWNDENNERYRSSYFEHYAGLWRHGDWVKITDRGSLVIYGRSDATLNRGGVRIGTSEVYSAVDGLSEVMDSMVVCIEIGGGQYYMPLFVVLTDGIELTVELRQKICKQLRAQFSPRHVPDQIFQIDEVPYTISGKKMETPVKKILMGMDLGKAMSKDAMKNPSSIEFFIKFSETGIKNWKVVSKEKIAS